MTVDTKMLHSFGRCNKSTTSLFSISVNESGTKSYDLRWRIAAFSVWDSVPCTMKPMSQCMLFHLRSSHWTVKMWCTENTYLGGNALKLSRRSDHILMSPELFLCFIAQYTSAYFFIVLLYCFIILLLVEILQDRKRDLISPNHSLQHSLLCCWKWSHNHDCL